MRQILLSFATVAGLAGAAHAAPVAVLPLPMAAGAPAVESVQYYRPYYGYGYGRPYRAYGRYEGYGRWRRHEEWRRWHHRHGW